MWLPIDKETFSKRYNHWSLERELRGRSHSINTFNEESTYQGRLYTPPSDFNPTTFHGKWKIKGGILFYHVDSSSDNNYPGIGKTTKDRIIYLDEDTFEYQNLELGFKSTMTRISNQSR
ncbi:MAG: hypothetical protein ACI8ZW_002365 [Yoonia sp.]|jgi:hypothetical protein